MDYPDNKNDIEELKRSIEKQIAVAAWLQAIGLVTEAVLLLKLSALSENTEAENEVVTGVLIQAIGQLIDAIGTTKQLGADSEEIITGLRLTITGGWLQALGNVIKAIAGEKVIAEEVKVVDGADIVF